MARDRARSLISDFSAAADAMTRLVLSSMWPICRVIAAAARSGSCAAIAAAIRVWILGALRDQARLLGGAPAEIEAHIVEAVGDAPEHGIAGDRRQLLMEAAVQDAEADRIVLDLGVGGDHVVQVVDVGARCLHRRLAHDFDLDDPAAFERVIEIGLRQRQEQVERRQHGRRVQFGDESATAMPRFDDAEDRKSPHRFAQARPADAEDLHQLSLRRQPVARPQVAGTDKLDDLADDLLADALLLDRTKPGYRQQF